MTIAREPVVPLEAHDVGILPRTHPVDSPAIVLDGQGLPNYAVPLSDDGKIHSVRVQLGEPSD